MSHNGRMARGKDNFSKNILLDNEDTKYYLANRDACRARSLQWEKEHPSERRVQAARYRAKGRERIRVRSRLQAQTFAARSVWSTTGGSVPAVERQQPNSLGLITSTAAEESTEWKIP